MVVPVVSVLIVTAPHPVFDDEFTPETPSVTSQVTSTLLTYHPFNPAVPVTVGEIDGDPVSSLRCVWLSANAAVFAPGEASTAEQATRWSPLADVDTSPERVVAVDAVLLTVTATPSTLQSRLATPDESVAVT
jgi:hypothetical protein